MLDMRLGNSGDIPFIMGFRRRTPRSEISNVKLFKRLKENSITGIYFGSRASEENILRARDKIEKSSLFGQSVTFHRSIESQDRFEINFEKL
ncbi:hypothetical protein [Obesumbacterium proteus]|uniref:Uncharacterized protein n=1 Tax=Obesumbacterium proteus ATCC 12841 TaxID=1354268 RepID=A0AA91ECD6_9GAMM|nr:hypothetical protein [Obesumbacterium proteus]OAT56748.1 hypothetical protein M993_04564 [Obesumbacterium proteus ATCC 12841]